MHMQLMLLISTSQQNVLQNSQVRPFFDCGRERDSAAAIGAFCQLARYATGEYRSAFAEHVNAALVSLLLHANDSVAETSHAARDGLSRVVGVVMPGDEERCARFRRHLAISCGNFTYAVFLRY